jgi:hypothetical protein
MNYIEHEWKFYARILPKHWSPLQVREVKRAFFAGAESFYVCVLKFLERGPHPTEGPKCSRPSNSFFPAKRPERGHRPNPFDLMLGGGIIPRNGPSSRGGGR